MRNVHLWACVAMLAACSGDDTKTDTTDGTPVDGDADTDTDVDTDTDTDTDTDVDCTATIVAVDPADGTRLVPLDQPVVVTFSEAIAPTDAWSLEVVPATGSATLAADGLSATWLGTLEGDTEYTVNASVCDSAGSSTFYSIAPPVDPNLLTGNTYLLSWDGLTVTEPGNGAAVQLLVGIDYILAQILAIDPKTSLADALATVGVDDNGTVLADCEVAVEQTADFTQNPYFSIDGDIEIAAGAGTVTVEDFSLLARASDDGTALTQVSLSGLIATEALSKGLDCYSKIIQALSPTCLPCTSSATGFCMLFEANAPQADETAIDLQATCAL